MVLNFVVFYTKESVEEIENILNNRAFYIDAKNELAYPTNTDTLSYVVKSIHKASKTIGA